MPPPRTTAILLQSPHTASRTSAPRHVSSNRYHSLTSHCTQHTRPTRLQTRQQLYYAARPTILVYTISTTAFFLQEHNYYEILDLPVTATAAEIKKQFYALSLRHHPDRNRDDPDASQRFAKISSAYNVLGNTQKRSIYDRDHGFHHAHHRAPTGSHSSHSANLHHKASYAGSRPPSGLSKRRGTFHGPPPSFYAQGGYGDTGRTGDGYAAGKAGVGADGKGGGGGGGEGTGKAGQEADPEDPMGFIDRNPLGHFNARGHFRTQKAEDLRRRERRSKARMAAKEKADTFMGGGEFGILRFVVVCGILVAAGAMTGVFKWPGAPLAEEGKAGKKRKEAVTAS
ncbi:uncharacterized protein N7482_002197 [Penicillium canariense]|uniref:J domain-containing protein n=1 Tax=Penicillium canariense TaxID=189055 RepID=A0A9W9II67_9EURO|nr:uncharacterized protein N7482_002197 [Penicillium canariense]KAJ5176320.1 hypothetical protein N7482_002197 [Penicillium canariense]